MSAPTCPFCKEPIREEIVLFGGHCPSCMMEIVGEEAPTDPGRVVEVRVDLPRPMLEQERRRRPAWAMVALVGLGAAGGWWFASRQGAGDVAGGDGFYVVPLSEHRDVPLPEALRPKPAPEPAPAPTPAKPAEDLAAKLPDISQAADVLEDEPLPTIAAREEVESPSAPVPRKARKSRKAREVIVAEAPPEKVEIGPSLAAASVAPNPLDAFKVGVAGPEERLFEGGPLEDPQQVMRMARRVMNAGAGQVRHCYEMRLKADPSLAGAWTVSFVLGASGKAEKVAVSGEELSDPELEACIASVVGDWSFHPVASPMEVSKRFRFGRG